MSASKLYVVECVFHTCQVMTESVGSTSVICQKAEHLSDAVSVELGSGTFTSLDRPPVAESVAVVSESGDIVTVLPRSPASAPRSGLPTTLDNSVGPVNRLIQGKECFHLEGIDCLCHVEM